MKETLKQLFGDAVTEEALKTFNSELGKKFVSKTDFNSKLETIKTLTEENKSFKEEIETLTKSASENGDVKKELEALKAKIEAEEKQRIAEESAKEKEKADERLFTEAIGEKEFSHPAIKSHYFSLFRDALSKDENKGKTATEILQNLTQEDSTAYKGVTAIRLGGGNTIGNTGGKKYSSKEEIMKIKDSTERQTAIRENPGLFIN